MTARTPRGVPLLEAPVACRQLAVRVIDRALKDALRSDRWCDSRSARSFLSGSWMLHYWCGVAGFDPARVIRAATAIMTGDDNAGTTVLKDAVTNRRPVTEPARLNTDPMAPPRK